MTSLPLTPPPELVQQWASMSPKNDAVQQNWIEIATQAAQWGADQELDACIAWMAARYGEESHAMRLLRAARRPKPLSLKKQALDELNLTADPDGAELSRTQIELIRRALEQLDD
jgi:hypothetical protein